MNDMIFFNMRKRNDSLSKYACKDEVAVRINECLEDIRTSFFRDIDRIIYSLSYVRYIDKTQVFSNIDNDMISKRITHVQMVSKIARTIGRALGLNEDLIEAASLGHDLGHVPFGHVGESILNKISLENNEGYFNHNVQSVRILMNIENKGFGSNICIQVLDAILCHNGESLDGIYEPCLKTSDDFLNEYNQSYYDNNILKNIKPMTLEGCVVRISDIIGYVGKDLDDALRLGFITLEDIPLSVSSVLGTSNSDIVNTIVMDVIENSFNKNYIKMSNDIFNALKELIDFNYKNIYYKANSSDDIKKYENMFRKLFSLYINHIENNDVSSDIFVLFLNDMNDYYNESFSNERKVIDYMAGMTDDFFMKQYEKYFLNN